MQMLNKSIISSFTTKPVIKTNFLYENLIILTDSNQFDEFIWYYHPLSQAETQLSFEDLTSGV